MIKNWNCLKQHYFWGRGWQTMGKIQTKLMPSVYHYQNPFIQAVWSPEM